MDERRKSVYRAAYVEPTGIPEAEFDRVFNQLKLTRPDEDQVARAALRDILDEYHTRSKAIEFAASKEVDLRDLKELLSRFRKANDGDWSQVVLFMRELVGSNPVLRRRLSDVFGKGGLGDARVLEQLRDHEQVVAALLEKIKAESRGGRRYDETGNWLANRVFEFWIRFTEQGTSRINWKNPNEGGPFPDFLREIGKLLDPHFNGYHLARRVHDEAKVSLQARRVEIERRWPRKSR